MLWSFLLLTVLGGYLRALVGYAQGKDLDWPDKAALVYSTVVGAVMVYCYLAEPAEEPDGARSARGHRPSELVDPQREVKQRIRDGFGNR